MAQQSIIADLLDALERAQVAQVHAAIARAEGYTRDDITLDPSSPFGFRAVS